MVNLGWLNEAGHCTLRGWTLMVFRLWVLTVIVIASGCVKAPPLHSIKGDTQGEEFRIHYWSYEALDSELINEDILGELEQVEQTLSSYLPGSALAYFNLHSATTPKLVGSEIVSLVRKAQKVYQASNGCFDLTSNPLLDLWGINQGQLLDPDQSQVLQYLEHTGMDKLEVVDRQHLRKRVSGVQVDLSSLLLGVSARRVIEVLEHYQVFNYHIVVGSKVIVRGGKPNGVSWRARVERPVLGQDYLDKIVTINTMSAMAIATSGTDPSTYTEDSIYDNPVLDPRVGRPVDHRTVSVTVFSTDPIQADAWSRALLCLGREKGLEVAEDVGVPSLFFEQNENGLQEFYSSSLRMLYGLRID